MTENQNPFDDTSKKVAELLEDVDESDDVEGGKLERILEEIGLTKSSFFRYVIIIVLLIFLFNWYFSGPSDSEKDQVINQNTQVEEESDVVSSVQNLDPSIRLGLISGVEVRNLQSFSIADKLGLHQGLALSLESYLLSYKRIKNLYDIDIQAHLDSKSNRVQAFDTYILEYKNSFAILKSSILKLEQEILNYKSKLVETTNLANALQEKFLLNVDSLNPYDLDLILNDFKEVNLRKTALTNELKSREIVFDRIANRNDIIQSQLDSLLANKEALIKGVTFSSIEGSKLNLTR